MTSSSFCALAMPETSRQAIAASVRSAEIRVIRRYSSILGHRGPHPLEIAGGARVYPYSDHFRHLVARSLLDRLLERREPVLGGFDHEQVFPFSLDAALPPIRRKHVADRVHARREPLLHERRREALGLDG